MYIGVVEMEQPCPSVGTLHMTNQKEFYEWFVMKMTWSQSSAPAHFIAAALHDYL